MNIHFCSELCVNYVENDTYHQPVIEQTFQYKAIRFDKKTNAQGMIKVQIVQKKHRFMSSTTILMSILTDVHFFILKIRASREHLL